MSKETNKLVDQIKNNMTEIEAKAGWMVKSQPAFPLVVQSVGALLKIVELQQSEIEALNQEILNNG